MEDSRSIWMRKKGRNNNKLGNLFSLDPLRALLLYHYLIFFIGLLSKLLLEPLNDITKTKKTEQEVPVEEQSMCHLHRSVGFGSDRAMIMTCLVLFQPPQCTTYSVEHASGPTLTWTKHS